MFPLNEELGGPTFEKLVCNPHRYGFSKLPPLIYVSRRTSSSRIWANWFGWLQKSPLCLERNVSSGRLDAMKLNIGGEEPRAGWKIFNIQSMEHVDYVGNCTDLSRFDDGSIDEIYASHVLEHLGYQREITLALSECNRVLPTGGRLYISVPNFGVLCQLFASEVVSDEQRWDLMRIMFGGQIDEYDFHKVGFIEPFLRTFLRQTGFTSVERVDEFNIFDDTSSMRLGAHLISLNIIATK